MHSVSNKLTYSFAHTSSKIQFVQVADQPTGQNSAWGKIGYSRLSSLLCWFFLLLSMIIWTNRGRSDLISYLLHKEGKLYSMGLSNQGSLQSPKQLIPSNPISYCWSYISYHQFYLLKSPFRRGSSMLNNICTSYCHQRIEIGRLQRG